MHAIFFSQKIPKKNLDNLPSKSYWLVVFLHILGSQEEEEEEDYVTTQPPLGEGEGGEEQKSEEN